MVSDKGRNGNMLELCFISGTKWYLYIHEFGAMNDAPAKHDQTKKRFCKAIRHLDFARKFIVLNSCNRYRQYGTYLPAHG